MTMGTILRIHRMFLLILKGEMVQFIFKYINPVDDDSPYIITMGIKEDGSYQSKTSTNPLYLTGLIHSEKPVQFIAN